MDDQINKTFAMVPSTLRPILSWPNGPFKGRICQGEENGTRGIGKGNYGRMNKERGESGRGGKGMGKLGKRRNRER